MADNKKYYYLKLKEDFFDSEDIKILESMENGYLYSNILLKMYLKSLKNNGELIFKEFIPYSPKMLATVTGHNIDIVEKALNIFKQLGLIELLDNGTIFMLDVQKFIGQISTEGQRKAEYRARIKAVKQGLIENKEESGTELGQCPDIISLSLNSNSISNSNNEEEKIERIDYQQIANMYKEICTSLPSIRSLTDSRKRTIKARLKTYTIDDFKTLFTMAQESEFLTGKNDRNWNADFDWLLKESNFAKVIEGNYENKQGGNNGNIKKADGSIYAQFS